MTRISRNERMVWNNRLTNQNFENVEKESMFINKDPVNDNAKEMISGLKVLNDIYFFGLMKSFRTRYNAAKIETRLKIIV
jgi:hypothetical protein